MNARARVCAVSYANSTPLVWGLLHGPQRGIFDLEFALPSKCADRLRAGAADIGLVPLIELARQPGLRIVPGICVGCNGPVRSIVLVSKKPFAKVEAIAADTGSRTSVVLAQVLAAHLHGTRPRVLPHRPHLDEMLAMADAALVIGDAALAIDPSMESWQDRPVHVYDMGLAWREMTGLPMVFAVWAAGRLPHGLLGEDVVAALQDSAAFGLRHIEDVVAHESSTHGLPRSMLREYLTRYVRYDVGDAEREAMLLYLKLAADLGLAGRPHELLYLPEPQRVMGATT